MYWHVTIAAGERLTLLRDEGARRRAVRALAPLVAGSALLFVVADDHLHLAARGERAAAGRLAQRVALALRCRADSPTEPARIRPVEGRAHLRSLVPYLLDQTRHHRLDGAPHPALWTGSCFADLVGARSIGFDAKPLREALPRLTSEDVFGAVGLAPVDPATDDALAVLGLEALVQVASNVIALDVRGGRTSAQVGASQTVATLGRKLGYRAGAVAAALAASERSVRRWWSAASDTAIEACLRKRVALERAVSDSKQISRVA